MARRRMKSADRLAVQPAGEEPAEGQMTEEICISPESVELFIKLKGGVASVRNTILAAFRESCFDGFQMLAAACLLVDNVTLCKNLIVVLTELGHYGEFRVLALTQLMTVVAYASSAEVREAAAQAIATLQSKSRGFDFLAGPRPFARQTRWPNQGPHCRPPTGRGNQECGNLRVESGDINHAGVSNPRRSQNHPAG